MHVLLKGFHRVRHYGLLATGNRKANIARARNLLAVPAPLVTKEPASSAERRAACPCCGGRMLVIGNFGVSPALGLRLRGDGDPDDGVERRSTSC